MENHRISFSEQTSINTGVTHPKRENPRINNCKRDPLANKQLVQQFMQSYINLNHLLSDMVCFENGEKMKKKESFPLANHINGYYEGTRTIQVEVKHKLQTIHKNHKKDHKNDTTMKTQPTNIDEESQFQNYLKQYETLVKNSRSKEFVSPMAHKKQIDELITEFLSDMQDSDIKSSEVSPKSAKNQRNQKVSVQERPKKSRNGTGEIVKIQTIDLSQQLKANSYQNSYKKSNKKEQIKHERQNQKIRQIQNVSKQRQHYVKPQQISVQPKGYQTNKKKKNDRVQNGEKTKSAQKTQDRLKIEVINVQDLRKRKNNQEDKQLKYARKTEAMYNQERAYQKAKDQKDSYLKQNLHKISKNDQKKLQKQKPKDQNSSANIKKEAQNIVPKKPLKIEIQISQYSSDEEQANKPIPELEQQKIQIIRMISKKVTNMLQNTQKIALNKGK